jgi:hypothetical protein
VIKQEAIHKLGEWDSLLPRLVISLLIPLPPSLPPSLPSLPPSLPPSPPSHPPYLHLGRDGYFGA